MKRAVRACAALVLGVGILCQFVQYTDPTPPFAYFTIWSAALGILTFTINSIRDGGVNPLLRGTTAVGLIVSGLIYATVIAPATATGTWFQPDDDYWVRTSTLLFHGIGPLLALTDFIITPTATDRAWRQAASWCVWPLLYLATSLCAQTADITPVPYPFLDPERTAPASLVIAIAVLTTVFLLTGRSLLVASKAWHRIRRQHP